VVYGIIVLAIWKIFSVSNEVKEIKEMVREIQRSVADRALAELAANPHSPEGLVRAVNAASYRDAEDDVLK
jgi:hypothetical protein